MPRQSKRNNHLQRARQSKKRRESSPIVSEYDRFEQRPNEHDVSLSDSLTNEQLLAEEQRGEEEDADNVEGERPLKEYEQLEEEAVRNWYEDDDDEDVV